MITSAASVQVGESLQVNVVPSAHENASAAGTTVPTSATTPDIPDCVAVASAIFMVKVSRAIMLKPSFNNWLLAAVIIVLDQITKLIVDNTMFYGQVIPVMPSFNIVLAYNKGAAFSLLANAGGWQRLFFSLIAVVASVGIIWVLRKHHQNKLMSLSLSLILGGALGNLIDRIAYGHVVDFIQVFLQHLLAGIQHRRQRDYRRRGADGAGQHEKQPESSPRRTKEPMMQVILANPGVASVPALTAPSPLSNALQQFGAPIYVRHEVVHNKFVVEDLKRKARSSSKTSTKCPLAAR